jgi:hypothetical protein
MTALFLVEKPASLIAASQPGWHQQTPDAAGDEAPGNRLLPSASAVCNAPKPAVDPDAAFARFLRLV